MRVTLQMEDMALHSSVRTCVTLLEVMLTFMSER